MKIKGFSYKRKGKTIKVKAYIRKGTRKAKKSTKRRK
jgi:hypothetical protein